MQPTFVIISECFSDSGTQSNIYVSLLRTNLYKAIPCRPLSSYVPTFSGLRHIIPLYFRCYYSARRFLFETKTYPLRNLGENKPQWSNYEPIALDHVRIKLRLGSMQRKHEQARIIYFVVLPVLRCAKISVNQL